MHQGKMDIIGQNHSMSFTVVKAANEISFDDSPGEPYASSASALAEPSSQGFEYPNHQE